MHFIKVDRPKTFVLGPTHLLIALVKGDYIKSFIHIKTLVALLHRIVFYVIVKVCKLRVQI